MKKTSILVVLLLLVVPLLLNCSIANQVIRPAEKPTGTPEQTMTVHVEPTNTVVITLTRTATSTVEPSATPTRKPTTPPPTKVPKPACAPPESITAEDKGKNLEVCGTVTEVNTVSCPECAYGLYSYISFGDKFRLISYDWIFNKGMVGYCYRVKDTVETLSGKPVFVVGSKEGYDGSECVAGANNTVVCEMDYFQSCK